MKSICVYCGSNSGNKPAYAERARALGARIAAEGLQLIYGGSHIGLMGELADATLAAGGEAIGVIPRQLVDWEIAHQGLSRLEIVESMHQRKARMFELADAFVTLPGGFGTLDEIFEMLTWRQLGISKKPCAFLDAENYYKPLINMIDSMTREGFLRPSQRSDIWHGHDIENLFNWLKEYKPELFSQDRKSHMNHDSNY